MKLQFYVIPAVDPEPAQAELNRFIGSHRVARVEKQWVADGVASFWSVCVTWVDGEAPGAPAGRRGRDIDYRDVLAPAEFAVYDRLRRWRKQLSEVEGLPVYSIFTNEQLAAIVQQRVAPAAPHGKESPACAAWRELEQQRQELPLGQPQRQPAR